MTRRTLHYRWEWELAPAPAALWPLVSDTDRFNRDAGLPPVEVVAGAEAGARRARLRRLGVQVEWDEEPFEWERPHRFGVVRRYRRGPLAEMRVRVELAPQGDGTRLVYEVDATPSARALAPAVAVEIGLLERRRFGATLERYAALAARGEPASSIRAPRLAPGAGDRLARGRETLARHAPPALAARLADALRDGDDAALGSIRPYELAETFGATRREALELCLQATRAGLLDLRWELLCPSCRGAKASVAHLAEIEPTVHCDGCHIDFAVSFDRSVEVRFRPNPAIRPLEAHAFCIGGPQLTPHVVAQARLVPGAETLLEPELEPGAHRLRATGVRGAVAVQVDGEGAGEAAVTLADGALAPDALVLSSRPRLHLANRTDAVQVVALERTAWSDRAATAAEVTALQLFRDLFASEALRPLEPISVGSLTMLFTDLRASTRFYREIGDATAFGRVMRHIDVVRDAVAGEGGAVVKTMGDAVMAVFTRPLAAVRAAFAAQAALRADGDGSPPLRLKVGLHHGPCIAITQDGRLDYFGSTVNAAARLVALATGDDVISTASVCDDPEVRAALAAGEVAAEGFEAELRGFEGEAFGLQRLRAVRS